MINRIINDDFPSVESRVWRLVFCQTVIWCVSFWISRRPINFITFATKTDVSANIWLNAHACRAFYVNGRDDSHNLPNTVGCHFMTKWIENLKWPWGYASLEEKKWWQLQMSLIYGDKRQLNPIGLNWYLQQYYQLISNRTVQKQFLLLLLLPLYIDVQNTLRFGFSWIFQWFLEFYWTVFFFKEKQKHSLKWCLSVKSFDSKHNAVFFHVSYMPC